MTKKTKNPFSGFFLFFIGWLRPGSSFAESLYHSHQKKFGKSLYDVTFAVCFFRCSQRYVAGLGNFIGKRPHRITSHIVSACNLDQIIITDRSGLAYDHIAISFIAACRDSNKRNRLGFVIDRSKNFFQFFG